MKTNILLIRIGGGLNILFLAFHLAFYWMLDWKNTLSCLSMDNRCIFLTFNIISNILIFFFVFISFINTEKLITEVNGKRLLFLMSFFYCLRIAVEFILWGYQGTGSLIIIAVCLPPAILYGIPLLKRKEI